MGLFASTPKYLRSLSMFNKPGPACPYCGNVIITKDGNYFVCSFCEMHSEEKQAKSLRGDIRALLTSKNNLILSNSWDEAAKLTEQIITLESTPQRLYSTAIFYEMFSNYCWHNIKYDLGGYMEQNSVNREKSWALLARSKSFFYESIKTCAEEIKTGQEVDLAFIKLLAESRVSKLADAKETLGIITKSLVADQVKDYACMVYYTSIKDPKSAMRCVSNVSTAEVSAFYYVAKLLANEKRTKDAKEILQLLIQKTAMPRAAELLFKINDLQNNV